MSDKSKQVLLITDDSNLQEFVERYRPVDACLRCLTPRQLLAGAATNPDQCWLDLDHVSPDAVERLLHAAQRRVYFYSCLPAHAERLPMGLFIRKPCGAAVISVLWAAAETGSTESRPACDRRPVRVPAWLLDFQELDLPTLCHKCVTTLPRRLGFSEGALYLYDPEQRVLALAETSCQRPVDLAIRVDAASRHAFVQVARDGEPFVSDDMRRTCRARGWLPPSSNHPNADQAALIAPLFYAGGLQGLLHCGRPGRGEPSDLDLPLRDVCSVLGRALAHARQFTRARAEARVDALTGLFNYRWMSETLANEVRRAERFASPLSLMLIDLDGLKQVNDGYGHPAGDAVLRHVAARIRSAVRQIDLPARIGGDEFAVLLPATEVEGARQVAQRVLSAIRSDGPVIDGATLAISGSVGVAPWRSGWAPADLVQAADRAMYAAKRQGGDRVAADATAPASAPEAQLTRAPAPAAALSNTAPSTAA